MIKETTAEKILDYILSHGGDFGEVFYEDTSFTKLRMTGREIETVSAGNETGTGIRIFQNGASLYFYTEGGEEETLFRLLKENWKGGKPQGGTFGFASQGRKHYGDEDLRQAGLPEKAALVERCNLAGLSVSDRISRMSTLYTDMDQQVFIANTEGLCARDRRNKTRLYIAATAKDGGSTGNSYIGPGAMRGFEYYEMIRPEDWAKKAAEGALNMLHAAPCPTGRMPVVIANGFGGLFFHEACGHSLEASAVADGASEFSGLLGQRVATDKVTLIDDGSMEGEWGSLHMDDEGNLTRRNVLIEKGILKGYMVDRFNGMKLGMEPTGSARRQNYRFMPTSRMTNTYIAPGEDSLEDMIASVERGIYVKSINAGSVNPETGAFNFNTAETYLIENGRIVKPVHGATLIGTGGDILKRVEMVGSDFELRQGFCYAASGAIYIGAGQPSVKISEMTVGGDEA